MALKIPKVSQFLFGNYSTNDDWLMQTGDKPKTRQPGLSRRPREACVGRCSCGECMLGSQCLLLKQVSGKP